MQMLDHYSDVEFLLIISRTMVSSINGSRLANRQFGIPLGAGVTAAVIKHQNLFIFTIQPDVVGLLGVMKGAAEYENLIGISPGMATLFMGPSVQRA